MRHAETGGEQARAEAEWHLTVARSQRPEVQRVAASLRDLREHNHFADLLLGTINKGRR